MRLALTSITAPCREVRQLRQAHRVVIDEVNTRGGDWMVILDEVLKLLNTALEDMFSKPDQSRGCSVVDLEAVGEWLADQLDNELCCIEHDV